MQKMLRRRVAVAGGGALLAGSLAATVLLRKPRPSVLTMSAEALPALHSLPGLEPPARPQAMPPIAFADADGHVRSVREFAGRGLVLNLWATWCAPCVAEMPSLAALARRLAGTGIVVLPLSLDRGGAATVRAFYADHHITGLGIWTDAAGRAEQALDVEGVPTTFIVDRGSAVVARLEGATDWGSDEAVKAVRGLIG